MIFFVRADDKEHTVRVENRKGNLFVKYDDEDEQPLDISFLGNDCTLFQGDSVFHANIVGQKNDFTVWRPEGSIPLQVESEYKRIVAVLRGQEMSSENAVYAKMPGKIVKILVKEGTPLEKGTPILVMEAMKMENEIRSPKPGKLGQISVKEGQAVETGALLAEISEE